MSILFRGISKELLLSTTGTLAAPTLLFPMNSFGFGGRDKRHPALGKKPREGFSGYVRSFSFPHVHLWVEHHEALV